MPTPKNRLTRRTFLRSTAFVGAPRGDNRVIGLTPARALPIELNYFYRAAWPTSRLAR